MRLDYAFTEGATSRAFLISADFCIRLLKRSTRPSVSINFWRPVKNGWHAEQISTRRSILLVDRVWKVLPQAQFTFKRL